MSPGHEKSRPRPGSGSSDVITDDNSISQPKLPAPVIRISNDRRGNRIALVACPYCGKRHTHGWPKGATSTRVSHCRDDRREYVITRYGADG